MEKTDKRYRQQLKFLTYYVIMSSIFFILFILISFEKKDKKEQLDELSVKKINIIGEDGNLRMVVSNETRQHSGRINGQDLPQRERPAGIIFFNNKGDECGGIIAEVSKHGKVLNSGMSFTMDNYHDDQVIQLLNDETFDGNSQVLERGLIVREYPAGTDLISRTKKLNILENIVDPKARERQIEALINKEGAKKRVFVGRTKTSEAGLFLYNDKGIPKLKIYIDSSGIPKIEVVDLKGKIRNLVQ